MKQLKKFSLVFLMLFSVAFGVSACGNKKGVDKYLEDEHINGETFVEDNITTSVEAIEGTTEYENIIIKNNSDLFINGLDLKIVDKTSQTDIDTNGFYFMFLRPQSEVKVIAKTQVKAEDIEIKGSNYENAKTLSEEAVDGVIYANDIQLTVDGEPVRFKPADKYDDDTYLKAKFVNNTDKDITLSVYDLDFYAQTKDILTDAKKFDMMFPDMVFGSEPKEDATGSEEVTIKAGESEVYLQSYTEFSDLQFYFYGHISEELKQKLDEQSDK